MNQLVKFVGGGDGATRTGVSVKHAKVHVGTFKVAVFVVLVATDELRVVLDVGGPEDASMERRLIFIAQRLTGVNGLGISGVPRQDGGVSRDNDGPDEVVGRSLNLVLGEQLEENRTLIRVLDRLDFRSLRRARIRRLLVVNAVLRRLVQVADGVVQGVSEAPDHLVQWLLISSSRHIEGEQVDVESTQSSATV